MGRRANLLLTSSLHTSEYSSLNESNEFFQAYLDRVPENDQETVRSQWQQAIEKGKPFTLNHCYLLPGGDRLQLRVQGSPVQRVGTQRYLGFVQVIESEETKAAN